MVTSVYIDEANECYVVGRAFRGCVYYNLADYGCDLNYI